MPITLEEFLPRFSNELPEQFRRYHDFDWSNLMKAEKVRMCPTNPQKHIDLGLVPSGICYDDYKKIWVMYAALKKLVSKRLTEKKNYEKNKNAPKWDYHKRLESGAITLASEGERKRRATSRKKRIDKLQKQATLFGICPEAVSSMDEEALTFWGQPLKSVNDDTGEISYINPCNFHYSLGSKTNLSLNMNDFV